jgi:hypothetical protein
VATVLLFLSMTRHIKRVPPTFPDSSRPAPPPGDQPE